MWKTGGHNSSQTVTETTWYIWKNVWVEDHHYEPKMLTMVSRDPTAKTKETIHAEMSFTTSVDEGAFDPPAFCTKVIV